MPPSYLHPYACFRCRRSFKRHYDPESPERTCPHCGGQAVVLGRKFRPPPADDLGQWKKVEYLVQHGFVFQTVHDDEGRAVRYPATLKDAQEFVRKHGHRVGGSTGKA